MFSGAKPYRFKLKLMDKLRMVLFAIIIKAKAKKEFICFLYALAYF